VLYVLYIFIKGWGDSFEVEVQLKNFTERIASFTFNTGQKFELELLKVLKNILL